MSSFSFPLWGVDDRVFEIGFDLAVVSFGTGMKLVGMIRAFFGTGSDEEHWLASESDRRRRVPFEKPSPLARGSVESMPSIPDSV